MSTEEENALATLSFERLVEAFKRLDWAAVESGEPGDQSLLARVNGFVVECSLLSSYAVKFSAQGFSRFELSVERFDAVVNWCNQFNRDTNFGAAYADLDEQESIVRMYYNSHYFAPSGCSNSQLEGWLYATMRFSVDAFNRFSTAFALK